ncbi:MAG: histidinol dehydrogenase [Sphaerochaetaceae bacterium]
MAMPRAFNPTLQQLRTLLQRPSMDSPAVEQTVREILAQVRSQGDCALFAYEAQFDHAQLDSLEVSAQEMDEARTLVPQELQVAIQRAMANIRRFHLAQQPKAEQVETEPGIRCWRRIVPIQTVGLYIPGGSAPLFSTVLMLSIPAGIAGCGQIVLATPPRPDGTIHPAILLAAALGGVTRIVKLGGAQAIAALAYGTQTIPRVDKIFGPGNRFVTMAKQLVSANTCAIDLPAGPSEVMVVADSSSEPAFAAADLLSQAEHGPDSQTILVVQAKDASEGAAFLDRVDACLEKQLVGLERRQLAAQALGHSKAVVVTSIDRVVQVINSYGPEHLIVMTADPDPIVAQVVNAGSVFIGKWSPESAGDYASGTNHTLPTAGWACSYSGVSVDSFIKKITYQQLAYEALASLGPTITTMAKAESLDAHAMAVSIRLATARKEEIL